MFLIDGREGKGYVGGYGGGYVGGGGSYEVIFLGRLESCGLV